MIYTSPVVQLSWRKWLYCLLCFLCVHPFKAVGMAIGPFVGYSGWYTSFKPEISSSSSSVVITTNAGQLGAFLKVDLPLLYIKLDPAFIFNHRTLTLPPKRITTPGLNPSKEPRESSQWLVVVPLTIGVSFFNCLRPHAGLLLRMPLDKSDNSRRIEGIEYYRTLVCGWLWGMGIDIGNFVVDLEFEGEFANADKKKIHTDLSEGQYTPKQFSVKVGYNLLG